MIRLVTGLPGSGKSLWAVDQIRKGVNEGRAVYVFGLDGLQPFGWDALDEPNAWEDLPDGSLIVMDEAQKVWGSRRTGEPSSAIRALSEHRHRGFDFLLVTQHPTMLDKYVRTLIGEHRHLLRQFGAQVSRIIIWTECHDDPQSLATRQRGTEIVWRYPKECYPLYKSATLHTVKRKLPLRLVALPFLLALVLGLGYYGIRSLMKIGAPVPATTTEGSAANRARTSRANFEQVDRDPVKYVAQTIPRVPAKPWSAPIFDDRKPKAEPQVFCASSETRCVCLTEQGTRYRMNEVECRLIAREGNYNPYLAPVALDRSSSPPGDTPAPSSLDGRGLKAGSVSPTVALPAAFAGLPGMPPSARSSDIDGALR